MKALEIFRNLRKQKIRFGLKRSMTVLVCGLVIVSLLLALGISEFFEYVLQRLYRCIKSLVVRSKIEPVLHLCVVDRRISVENSEMGLNRNNRVARKSGYRSEGAHV